MLSFNPVAGVLGIHVPAAIGHLPRLVVGNITTTGVECAHTTTADTSFQLPCCHVSAVEHRTAAGSIAAQLIAASWPRADSFVV